MVGGAQERSAAAAPRHAAGGPRRPGRRSLEDLEARQVGAPSSREDAGRERVLANVSPQIPTAAELASIEAKLAVRFPPSYHALLQAGVPWLVKSLPRARFVITVG